MIIDGNDAHLLQSNGYNHDFESITSRSATLIDLIENISPFQFFLSLSLSSVCELVGFRLCEYKTADFGGKKNTSMLYVHQATVVS